MKSTKPLKNYQNDTTGTLNNTTQAVEKTMREGNYNTYRLIEFSLFQFSKRRKVANTAQFPQFSTLLSITKKSLCKLISRISVHRVSVKPHSTFFYRVFTNFIATTSISFTDTL